MQIAGREISSRLPPYIVAELSCNHAGLFSNAIKLLEAAKEAGADTAKLQCYDADDMTIDCDKPDFIIKDGPWKGRKLYELYAKAGTPREWFPPLFALGKEIGITVFSSVFSKEGVDFLEGLDCPAYKIASMEVTDTDLIAYAAKTGKPLIISTGMATADEIHMARLVTAERCALLHCVSGYPSKVEEAGLYADMFTFGDHAGISDHTLGCDIPIAATALGAQIIEKHLALPNVESEDSEFSMMPDEFADMVRRVKSIWQATQPSERKSEESSRQLRRSLYVVQDIKAGEAFTGENVRSIRPSYGMVPKELPNVLKSFAACNIERGTALEEHMILPF